MGKTDLVLESERMIPRSFITSKIDVTGANEHEVLKEREWLLRMWFHKEQMTGKLTNWPPGFGAWDIVIGPKAPTAIEGLLTLERRRASAEGGIEVMLLVLICVGMVDSEGGGELK